MTKQTKPLEDMNLDELTELMREEEKRLSDWRKSVTEMVNYHHETIRLILEKMTVVDKQ